jgi:hypothetical protein
MRKIGIATVATLLWLALALAIDRWIVEPYCATWVKTVALDLKIKMPGAEMNYPRISVLVLLVPPMVLLALYLVPWKHLRMCSEWRDSLARWCQPWFWLIIAVLLTVIGESVYSVFKDYLVTELTDVADRFSVALTLRAFKNYTPISLNASLPGLVGLAIGSYLFIARGMRDILDLQSPQAVRYLGGTHGR